MTILILCSTTCFAATNWSFQPEKPNKTKTHNFTKTLSIDQLLFPAKSKLSSGLVKKHKLPKTAFRLSSFNFFVIGDDPRSIVWAKKHAIFLKKIHAVGFLTNVKTQTRFDQIKNDTGLSLMIVSLDGLSHLLSVSHYPFLVYQGFILQ